MLKTVKNIVTTVISKAIEYMPYLIDFYTRKRDDNIDAWQYALSVVLKHEGLLANYENDPGGITNYGVSLAFLKEAGIDVNLDGIIDEKDVLDLSKEDAIKIFKENWWLKFGYNKLADVDIATIALDFAVNMGVKQANKLIQSAYNRLPQEGVLLEVDGILGSKSLEAINNYVAIHGAKTLFDEIKKNAEHFYVNLVADKPVLEEFKDGWLNRVDSHKLREDNEVS